MPGDMSHRIVIVIYFFTFQRSACQCVASVRDQEAFYKSESCLKRHRANFSVSGQFPRRDSKKGLRAWGVPRESPKRVGGAGKREGDMLSKTVAQDNVCQEFEERKPHPF